MRTVLTKFLQVIDVEVENLTPPLTLSPMFQKANNWLWIVGECEGGGGGGGRINVSIYFRSQQKENERGSIEKYISTASGM